MALRSVASLVALILAAGVVALSGCKSGGRPTAQEREVESIRADDLVVRAGEALDAGDQDEALRLLAAAIEENPTLTTAHLKMGDIYRVAGDYTKAERSFATAATLEPRSFDAQYGHGLTLHLLNRLAEAVRAYLRALAVRPDDFNANLNIATAFLQLGEPRQAVVYAENAVRVDPSSGAAHANLGAIYAATGRHNDAVREYESAAELMELTPELLLNLSESLGKTGRYEEMEITLDRVLEMEPSAAAWERIGYARFKSRDYSGAEEAFRTSIELDGAHYPALNGLGVCLLNQYLISDRKDDEARREAVRLFRRSLRINNRQNQILELVSRFG